jgi:TfoX/Sxy family transcriptional regulator of competence genes
MAFDPVLAERVRDLFAAIGPVHQIRMFGGIALMLHGHMCVCVRNDELYIRLGQEGAAAAIAAGEAQPFQPTGGKQAFGFVTVIEASALDDGDLEAWVERAIDFVRTLPPKAIL